MADYFSRLPEPLIHRILSFLPFEEIGRTCVLSKYFNTIWWKYPSLDFRLVNTDYEHEQAFFEGAENSFGQCLVRRPFIQQLRLLITCSEVSTLLTPYLDRWLCLSVDKNVSMLVLKTMIDSYSLPQQLFVSPTLRVLDLTWSILEEHRIAHIHLPRLEKLSLSHCWVKGDNLLQKIACAGYKMKHISLDTCRGSGDRILSVPGQVFVGRRLEVLDLTRCILNENCFVHIELPCLEKLSLNSCHFVGNNLLQKILYASPKVKHISLKECRGLGSCLSVSGTPLLKHFVVRCNKEFERIKIDAPNLETFTYESLNVASAIDLTSCTNLKKLCMFDGVITVLEHLQSVFLGIQVLELRCCCLRKKYKISSLSLERLILHGAYRLNDVEIDAPNLKSLEFSIGYYLSFKFKFSSWRIPKADDIHFEFSPQSFRKAWRAGLQDFLVKLPNYEDLKLFIYDHQPTTDSMLIMIKELHAVSFSSLQKFAKKSSSRDILISSRDEANVVHEIIETLLIHGDVISMICSSAQSTESYVKKLGNWSIFKDQYSLIIELVSLAEIQMCSAWESFLKSNSRGNNHSAIMILRADEG